MVDVGDRAGRDPPHVFVASGAILHADTPAIRPLKRAGRQSRRGFPTNYELLVRTVTDLQTFHEQFTEDCNRTNLHVREEIPHGEHIERLETPGYPALVRDNGTGGGRSYHRYWTVGPEWH